MEKYQQVETVASLRVWLVFKRRVLVAGGKLEIKSPSSSLKQWAEATVRGGNVQMKERRGNMEPFHLNCRRSTKGNFKEAGNKQREAKTIAMDQQQQDKN